MRKMHLGGDVAEAGTLCLFVFSGVVVSARGDVGTFGAGDMRSLATVRYIRI
jgi:hypothetical protein